MNDHLHQLHELLDQERHLGVRMDETVLKTVIEEAVVRSLIVVLTRREASGDNDGWDRLSAQEQSISVLVGEALTNGQIARRVGLSSHTVNYHLRRIFQKLGIGSRVELARLAAGQVPRRDTTG